MGIFNLDAMTVTAECSVEEVFYFLLDKSCEAMLAFMFPEESGSPRN